MGISRYTGSARGMRDAVRGILLGLLLVALGMPAVTADAGRSATPPATPTESTGNGCTGEQAGDPTVRCPVDGPARDLIDYIRSFPGGVTIALTPEGVQLGLTCDGAARLVELASELYEQIPRDHRSYEDLLWANPDISREVYGHALATERGFSRGNPVDVVFADYSRPTAEGTIWQSGVVDLIEVLTCRP